jgi:hypothetical protein
MIPENNAILKVLVGNKFDLERNVSFEEADTFSKSRGFIFFETSAKTSRDSIMNLFDEIVNNLDKYP